MCTCKIGFIRKGWFSNTSFTTGLKTLPTFSTRCSGLLQGEDLRVEEDEMLVSFDVSSLFTNVPIDEVVQVIRDRLRRDETLVNRTTLS